MAKQSKRIHLPLLFATRKYKLKTNPEIRVYLYGFTQSSVAHSSNPKNHTSVYSIEETYSPERCSVKIIATKSKQISLPGVPLAVSAYGGIVAALLSLSHC